jgi:hypothetical protein
MTTQEEVTAQPTVEVLDHRTGAHRVPMQLFDGHL